MMFTGAISASDTTVRGAYLLPVEIDAGWESLRRNNHLCVAN